MAVVEGKFYSEELNKQMGFVAILPVDTPESFTTGSETPNQITKVLYLLHGYSGNEKDWIHHAPVIEVANKYNMAIILPQGDNSFYLDHEKTQENYGRYIGIELVEKVKRMFGINLPREKTFIGGLSMGGFGALRNGLFYSETFGGIIALSSALILEGISKMKPEDKDGMAPYGYYESVLGDLQEVLTSNKNPKVNAKQFVSTGRSMNIYIACGVDDFLIEQNRDMHDYLDSIGCSHCYVEDQGAHEWGFWNKYIQEGAAWLNEKA